MPCNQHPYRRTAFSVVEVTVALAIVAVVSVTIAQVVIVSLRERARSAARQAALELAANVLESARAEPFAKLDADWAKAQSVPSVMSELLPAGKLVIAVGPDAGAPNAKVVSVEVLWREADDQPLWSVRLTTVVGPRNAKSAGGAS
ncbi:MAG: hypothetical protein EXS16_17820 [Gemmataceae bacterium]|nr:hypothetical protein [Gemmataceae bacterium]